MSGRYNQALLVLAVLAALHPAPLRAQAAPTLARIGPNAARPLAVGEVGWLVATPADAAAALACEGCAIAVQGCNAVCTYQVLPTTPAWRAHVGALEVAQGARVYLPMVSP